MELREFTSNGTPVEFINRLLGEVLTPGDVDGLQPTALAPAPRRYLRDANLHEPAVQTDYRNRAV